MWAEAWWATRSQEIRRWGKPRFGNEKRDERARWWTHDATPMMFFCPASSTEKTESQATPTAAGCVLQRPVTS